MLAIASVLLAAAAASAAPPSILFILADDMGRSDLHSLYPNNATAALAVQTPVLDELAASGMKFDQAYSGPVCAPSRCMLVTGRNIGNCTIRGNDGAYTPFREADKDNNIAGTLRKAGYTSALFGKWGLGDYGTTGYPTNQSFDTFEGYDSQVACHNWYPDTLFAADSPLPVPENANACNSFSEDIFRNRTVAFLEERARTPEKPFFAWVSYVTPHSGFCNHEKSSHVQPGPYAVPTLEPEYANRSSWEEAYKGYASAITRQDRDTGILLDALKRLGLADNTIVLFASDNGPEAEPHVFFDSAGPLRGYKRSLFEGGIRAPLLARWPGQVPAGFSSDAVVSFYDILPTLADLAGLPTSALPPGTDGQSFKNALLGRGVTARKPLYWEFCYRSKTFEYGPGWGQAVRNGDLKLIRVNFNYTAQAAGAPQSDVSLFLFDLRADEGEQTNLAGQKQYQGAIETMISTMDAEHVEDPYWPSGPNCCDHQYKPDGPCTPANAPYPPHKFPTMPGREVPEGFRD